MKQELVNEMLAKREKKERARKHHLAEAERLDAEIVGFDEVLILMGVNLDAEASQNKATANKPRASGARKQKKFAGFKSGWTLVMHILQEAGEAGVQPKKIIQKANEMGVELKRKTVASQLSVARKDGRVDYDDGQYIHTNYRSVSPASAAPAPQAANTEPTHRPDNPTNKSAEPSPAAASQGPQGHSVEDLVHENLRKHG